MRHPTLCAALPSAAIAAVLFALPAAAQELRGVAFEGDYHATTLAVFSPDFSVAHMVTLTHGQPQWKDSYDFDTLMEKFKGSTQRLGKNWWTTLMTSTPVEIGGQKLPAGSYCMAMHIAEDGKLALALIDSGKAMLKGLMPFFPNTWKPDYLVPLELHQDAADEVVEELTMTFTADAEKAGKGTLTIAWGTHELTAAAIMHLAKK